MSKTDNNTPRLFTAAKEFNIGSETLIKFLESKGFNRKNLNPTVKLTEQMYNYLQKRFQDNRVINMDTNTINIDLQFSNFENKPIQEHIYAKIYDKAYAIQKVKKCYKEKETFLNLSDCGLVDFDLTINSELGKNLSKCTSLEILVLNGYYLTLNKNFEKFTPNYDLNKGNKNLLTILPQCISNLFALKKLICSGLVENIFKIENTIYVSKLKNINYLDLNNNNISDLRPLENLISLNHLYVGNNNIQSLKSLNLLKSLSTLVINNNKINDLSGIENLTSLSNLNIENNEIKKVEVLGIIKNLKHLKIGENKIEDLNDLNFIKDKGEDFYIEVDENPFVRNHQLKLLKDENHFRFIKELLLRQVDTSNKSTLTYPIKILMLGNHGSGKSSLVNYLTNKEPTDSTHILRIENYFIEESVQVLPDSIFFDFGGQDFYHGLYQAFMSKGALQLILFENETDKNELSFDINEVPVIHFNRKYWLGQKQYQENGSKEVDSYIMIQTYAEDDRPEADAVDTNLFIGFKKSFYLSFKSIVDIKQNHDEKVYEAGRQYFKTYLNNLIQKNQIKIEEPIWYVEFLKFVLKKDDKTSSSTKLIDILKIYHLKNVSEEDKMASLKTNLVNLHRHGLVLYYQHINQLENLVWLNPQKLVEHIQTNILNPNLFNHCQNKTPGVISKITFEKIVQDEDLLLLLIEQKVVFLHDPTRLLEDKEYIIPNYLPLFNKNESDSQLFTFGFYKADFIIRFTNFIPFGFINQIVCFFGKQPDVKKFWRNKLIFTLQNEARVMIELDFEHLCININFHSVENSKIKPNHFTEYLFFSIMALYWNYKNENILSFAEFLTYKNHSLPNDEIALKKYENWISIQNNINLPLDLYISLDSLRYVKYSELVNYNKIDYTICSYGLKNNSINVNDKINILVGPFAPFTTNKLPTMKKIFIAYSKHDQSYLEAFEKHLIGLKNEGIKTFNCSKIEFGKEWDDEIKKQLDECDIMVCLVSVDFLNTNYINEIEIPKAINENKIIIPIIIRPCDWENSNLGKYQAAQRGKIVSLNNDLKLLGQIKSYTSEEKDAFWTNIIKELRKNLSAI